eukprot:jgi/Picsp_1/1181/NSC_04662-R1_---NA---
MSGGSKKDQLLEWGPNVKATYKKKESKNVDEAYGDVYNCLNCVDSNAWLSKDEREQLRSQIKEEEEEAARRNSNSRKVTIDLLGRRVLIADDTGDGKCEDETAVLLEVAKSATMAEKPRGGGASVVGHHAAAFPPGDFLPSGGNASPDGVHFTRSTYLFVEPKLGVPLETERDSLVSRTGKRRLANKRLTSRGGIVDYDEDLSQLGFVQV